MEHQAGVRVAEITTQMTTSKSIWEPSIRSALLQHKESRQDHIWRATNCRFQLMVKPGVPTKRMDRTRYTNYFPKLFKSAHTRGHAVGTWTRLMRDWWLMRDRWLCVTDAGTVMKLSIQQPSCYSLRLNNNDPLLERPIAKTKKDSFSLAIVA